MGVVTATEINHIIKKTTFVLICFSLWEKQKKTVEKILETILGDNYNEKKIIEIWNKSDLLKKEDLAYFRNSAERNKDKYDYS